MTEALAPMEFDAGTLRNVLDSRGPLVAAWYAKAVGMDVVLVCGSRNWIDRSAIVQALRRHDPRKTLVIHGKAPGADRMADTHAVRLGFPVVPFPAEWEPGPETRRVKTRRDGTEYDPEAGFRRNLEMLATEPILVIAFQRGGSGGTQHTIDNARALAIPVEVYVD